MSLINHEELKKQLASGEITSLDDITEEFKNILKVVIQTATKEELTSHLGYDKHQESNSSNARKAITIKQSIQSMVNLMFLSQEIEIQALNHS